MSRRNRSAQVSAPAAVAATETTQPVAAPVTKRDSIRQLVIGELRKGTNRKVIAGMIQEKFPTSAAAAKSSKHISWYAGRLKKDGEVLPPQAPDAPVAVEAAEQAAAE